MPEMLEIFGHVRDLRRRLKLFFSALEEIDKLKSH